MFLRHLGAIILCAAGLVPSAALRIWPTIVEQGSVKLLERFGEYKWTLEPGLHWIIPCVDRARTIQTREIVIDMPPQNCISADNAPLKVDGVLYFSIFNPVLAAYGVVDLKNAIFNLAKTKIRAEIGKLTLEETFSAREALSATLVESLDTDTDPWGVKVSRVEIQEIIPPPEVLVAMEKQLAAERDKRATILKSEGQRESQENVAQASKRAAVLEAEAKAEAVEKMGIAEAEATRRKAQATRDALAMLKDTVGVSDAVRVEIVRQYTESTIRLASSENAKTLVLPRGDEWLARVGAALGPEKSPLA